MWPSAELAMYILGGFLAAWGSSLIFRTRATRRVARGQCAQCKRRWLDDEHTCPRCGSDKSRQSASTIPRPTTWALVGLTVVLAGLTGPFWSLHLLGWMTGTSRVLRSDLGFIGAIGLLVGSFALITLVAAFLGDPARGRHRCRKCWYPMQPAVPATCPECGKPATKDHDLLRTRRPLRPILAGLALLVIAQLGWFDPYIRQHGLVSLVPTDVLISNINIVPSHWIDVPVPAATGYSRLTNRPTWQREETLCGRIRDGRLTAQQLKRVGDQAVNLVSESSSIAEMRAAINLAELAATATPSTPGTPVIPMTPYSQWRYSSWPLALEIGPSTPEINAAYVRAVTVVVRQLQKGDARTSDALDWLLEQPDIIYQTGTTGRSTTPQFRDQIVAHDADLRHLSSHANPHVAAGAMLLRSLAGTADASDAQALASLVQSLDPTTSRAAELALGALALRHPQAASAWTSAVSTTTGPQTGSFVDQYYLPRGTPHPGAQFASGAHWRASLGSTAEYLALQKLSSAAPIDHHLLWAAQQELPATHQRFALALVDQIIADPSDDNLRAIFDALGDARMPVLNRWLTLLRPDSPPEFLDQMLRTIYDIMVQSPRALDSHRDTVASFAAEVERRSAEGQREHFRRFNILARAQSVLDWIDGKLPPALNPKHSRIKPLAFRATGRVSPAPRPLPS